VAWFTAGVSDEAAARELLTVLHEAADAVVTVLADHRDWGPSGGRVGQHSSDVVADRAAVGVLHRAGLRVLSEESGFDAGVGLVAVLDPLDGSTNAARGLPWFATSVCVVDEAGPFVSLVHDLAGGDRFDASRGGGARRNGETLPPRRAVPLAEAIIGVNDVPPGNGGWAQFRALGAVALDLCAVADGRLDGYVDFAPDSHGVWDYLGAALVCAEVGVGVVDAGGRDLGVLDHEARRMPVAAPEPLLAELLAMRSTLSGTGSS
jgi:fructose-1,6-bisphosphatase/inositol monophosphatase family enzyme